MKEEKKEQKGFFGAISSLFLTPTENERLVKKWLMDEYVFKDIRRDLI